MTSLLPQVTNFNGSLNWIVWGLLGLQKFLEFNGQLRQNVSCLDAMLQGDYRSPFGIQSGRVTWIATSMGTADGSASTMGTADDSASPLGPIDGCSSPLNCDSRGLPLIPLNCDSRGLPLIPLNCDCRGWPLIPLNCRGWPLSPSDCKGWPSRPLDCRGWPLCPLDCKGWPLRPFDWGGWPLRVLDCSWGSRILLPWSSLKSRSSSGIKCLCENSLFSCLTQTIKDYVSIGHGWVSRGMCDMGWHEGAWVIKTDHLWWCH